MSLSGTKESGNRAGREKQESEIVEGDVINMSSALGSSVTFPGSVKVGEVEKYCPEPFGKCSLAVPLSLPRSLVVPGPEIKQWVTEYRQQDWV